MTTYRVEAFWTLSDGRVTDCRLASGTVEADAPDTAAVSFPPVDTSYRYTLVVTALDADGRLTVRERT